VLNKKISKPGFSVLKVRAYKKVQKGEGCGILSR
jgi:hypothetical protein